MKTYAILSRATQAIKVGKSINPEARLRTIKTSCPGGVELLKTWDGDLERDFHFSLREYCIGGEWFRGCPEVAKILEVELCQRADVDPTDVAIADAQQWLPGRVHKIEGDDDDARNAWDDMFANMAWFLLMNADETVNSEASRFARKLSEGQPGMGFCFLRALKRTQNDDELDDDGAVTLLHAFVDNYLYPPSWERWISRSLLAIFESDSGTWVLYVRSKMAAPISKLLSYWGALLDECENGGFLYVVPVTPRGTIRSRRLIY